MDLVPEMISVPRKVAVFLRRFLGPDDSDWALVRALKTAN
jgi:hypothetical protein